MARSRDFMIGVLLGGAVGAIAALVCAPMAGNETRQLIKDKALEAKDKTAELGTQAKTRVTGIASQAQTSVTELADDVKAKTGEISHKAHDLLERSRQVIDHQKEAIRTAVEAGKQAYVEKQSELQAEVDTDVEPAEPTSV